MFSNIKYWDLRKVSLEKPKSLTAKTKIKKPCTNSSFTLNNFSYLETKIRKMNEEAESLKMNVSNIDYTYFVYEILKFTCKIHNFIDTFKTNSIHLLTT